MKKLVITVLSVILLTGAAIGAATLLSNKHSSDVQSELKDIYVQDYSYGYYKDNPDDVKIVGYKDIGNNFHAIDLQLMNVGHGARYGVNINRVVFKAEEDKQTLVTIMPDNKVSMSEPKASEALPADILKQILALPLSPPIHQGETTAFDFYSGDLTDVSRTKLTDWFVNKTIDTRLSNMSVRKGSYAKTEDTKSTHEDNSVSDTRTHEKTFIRPASTVTFILDIRHPKSSYKITQKVHKEAPSRDTLHLSCLSDKEDADSSSSCGGDIKL